VLKWNLEAFITISVEKLITQVLELFLDFVCAGPSSKRTVAAVRLLSLQERGVLDKVS
jgi:hypothetical protein